MFQSNALFRLIACCIFIFHTTTTQAQNTLLVLRQKGKNITSVNISLCDKTGNKAISPDVFRKADRVYFLVEPKEGFSKPVFHESEVKEELTKIVLWQPQPAKYLTPEITPVITDKRINAAILAYPKSETRAHLPFAFAKDGNTSEELLLSETYYDQYPQFRAMMEQLRQQIESGDFLEAYYNTMSFLNKEETKEYLGFYSFSQAITEELPLLALTKGAEQVRALFERKLEEFTSSNSKNSLEALQKAAMEAERYLRQTAAFKEMGNEAARSYSAIAGNLEAYVGDQLQKAEQNYLESRFALLMGQSYHDQRFSTFIDLIYLSLLQSYRSSTNAAEGFKPRISAGKREELTQLNWLEDLEELFFAMEKYRSATTDAPMLPAAVLQHLETLQSTQPKPYFEILKVATGGRLEPATRLQLLQTAINTCTSEKELAWIELWKLSAEPQAAKSDLLSEGISQLESNNLSKASELFDQALRQQPNDAHAWYFRALAHYRLGENYAAEAKVDKAMEINQELISPQLLKITLLKESKNTETLNQIFSRPAGQSPVYLFEMAKARFLIDQNKAAEAIKVLENGPLVLCPGQTTPYFLMGDAYVAMKQPEKARQAYLKTQQINPFDSSIFEEKMRALEKK